MVDFFKGLGDEIENRFPNMRKDIYWYRELEDRKLQLAQHFDEALDPESEADYYKKVEKLIKSKPKTAIQKNLQNYISGQKNIKRFLKQSFNYIKQNRKENRLDEILTEVDFKGKPTLTTYRKSRQQVTGYLNGKPVKARVERYLDKGEYKFKLRDNKGRFVSLLPT